MVSYPGINESLYCFGNKERNQSIMVEGMTINKEAVSEKRRSLIFQKYVGHCAFCGKKISKDSFAIEYGAEKLQNRLKRYYELLPACLSCANEKRGMELESYRQFLQDKDKHPGSYSSNVKRIQFYFEKLTRSSESDK